MSWKETKADKTPGASGPAWGYLRALAHESDVASADLGPHRPRFWKLRRYVRSPSERFSPGRRHLRLIMLSRAMVGPETGDLQSSPPASLCSASTTSSGALSPTDAWRSCLHLPQGVLCSFEMEDLSENNHLVESGHDGDEEACPGTPAVHANHG